METLRTRSKRLQHPDYQAVGKLLASSFFTLMIFFGEMGGNDNAFFPKVVVRPVILYFSSLFLFTPPHTHGLISARCCGCLVGNNVSQSD